MRGQRRHGPKYEVAMRQIEDLVRQERPPPLTEVRPLPPTPNPLPLTPNLPPTLPSPNMGSKGAPFGGKGNGTTRCGQEELLVETNNLPVTTSLPSPSTTLSGGNEEGEETTANGGEKYHGWNLTVHQ